MGIQKTTLSFFYLCVLLTASIAREDFEDESNNNGSSSSLQQQGKQLKTFRYSPETDNFQPKEDLRVNRTYLNFSEKKGQIRDIRTRDQVVTKEFQEFNDLSIATDVKKVPFSPLSFIQIHPNLPTSIILPSNILITYVDIQPQTVEKEFDFNFLDLKPMPELTKVAVTLKYIYDSDPKEHTKVNTMKIIVDRYTQTNEKDKTLYTVFEYAKEDGIEPSDLLDLFYKKYGEYPKSNDAIMVNGTVYEFIEDQINGVVSVDTKKYRINKGK